MAIGVTQMALQTLTMMKCDLQYFLTKLSDDLQYQQMQNSENLAQMNKKHEREVGAVRAKFSGKDTVSGSDLTNLQREINSATSNPITADPTATTADQQAALQRDTESYMQEMSEMSALTSKHDTEQSTLIAENNSKEKSIEQQITPMEARLKSTEANLENTDKAAKKFAEESVTNFARS